MVGPLQIRYFASPLAVLKLEAVCHWCHWSWFEYDEAKLKNLLLEHIDTAHINPPPPIDLTNDQMPGR